MNSPYTAPIPPTPRPPGVRPLRKRVAVWTGGLALFIAGAVVNSSADDQQSVADEARPAVTVSATPEPGPTVTETVEAEPSPGPTVTVTKTAAARAPAAKAPAKPPSGRTGSGSGDEGSTGTCSIVSNSGNCYSAGQFCRNSDHGAVTTTQSGTKIKCAHRSNSWRWTYI